MRTRSLSALRLAGAALVTLAALVPGPARAGVPSPPNCTVQSVLIGSWNGAGASADVAPCLGPHPELFEVVVRDIANTPIPGAVVKVLFPPSGPRPHLAQNPGVQTICPGELAFTADASGTALVSLRFAGWTDLQAVSVYSGGVLLANLPARSPDYDGDGTVGLPDLADFASDYLDPLAGHPRSDFDNCPSTKLPDLTFFVTQYLASNGQPPAALCP